MRKSSISQKLLHVLFWSIISAAFIGPGTVTTASKAGATFGFSLIWALVFSVVATLFLQEGAARLSLASGKNIGQILRNRYSGKSLSIAIFIFLCIAFGCAAYQAGNILGAVSGLALLSETSKNIWVLMIGLICFGFLWKGSFKWIAQALGVIVAAMGIMFLFVAFSADINSAQLGDQAFRIAIPEGSGLLVIGLIGTTIVPYNLFLGSGIARDQKIRDMRFGLTVAILIGGIISLAILIVGTLVKAEFSFEALAQTLSQHGGPWMKSFFGLALFAAGLSSSITAPFAAAITAQSVFQKESNNWHSKSRNFRWVWMVVLVIGMSFGLADIKPIPAIILAQAINGILLPAVSVWLWIFVNDQALLGKYANRVWQNIVFFFIVWICIYLGLYQISGVIYKIIGEDFSTGSFKILMILSLLIILPVVIRLYRMRR